MGHVHEQPGHHDLTVSAYIVDISGPEARLLLHRHKRLGLWLQPGGHVELDENPWAAMCREIGEETGYDMAQLTLLQPRDAVTDFEGSHPLPLAFGTHRYGDEDHYHTDLCYGFVTREQPAGELAADESATLTWFTLDEFSRIVAADMPRHTRAIGGTLLAKPERWRRVPLGN